MRLRLALAAASSALFVAAVDACSASEPDAASSVEGDAAPIDGAPGNPDDSGGGDDAAPADANGSDADQNDANGSDGGDAGPALTVKTNLILWLAADQGVNASGFTWSDLSGGGHDATQTNAAYRPTKQDMFFANGMPAVVVGAQQELVLPGSPLFDDFSNGVSIFLVYRPSLNIFSYPLHLGAPANRLALAQTPSEGWAFVTSGKTSASNKAMTTNELHLFEVLAGGGNSAAVSLFRDGVAAGTDTTGVTNVTREPNFLGGGPPADAGTPPTYVSQGAYAEILVYKSLVTPMQQQAIESYLMARWGL